MKPACLLDGLRILIVEDEALVALDLSQMIRGLGGEVVGPASTLDAATMLLGVSKVDGAIMDLNLGRESSAPFAETLTALGIPVVLITGYAKEMLPQSLAGVPRLSKPYNVRELQELITRCLSPQ